MAIRIPRGSQSQTRLPSTNFLQIAERSRLPLETIGNAINNLGQTILDAENEKQKIRLQNDLINAETELNREVFKRSNELFQSGYDYSPSSIEQKAQENIQSVDRFIFQKFKDNPEALKYTDKLKFGAYQLFEKNLYENSNKRLQLNTISTHEDKLQSTLEIIENGKIGPGMWTNYHGTQKEELRTTRNNAEKYGGSFDQEKEEYALELLIMKKALGKQSSVNPITGQPEIDYTGIIQKLNNPEYEDIFGETITTAQRKDLRAWAKKGQTDANASTSNFIKVENAKASLQSFQSFDDYKIHGDIVKLQNEIQMQQKNFKGTEGIKAFNKMTELVSQQNVKGFNTQTNLLINRFVQNEILDNKITNYTGDQIINAEILKEYNQVTGKNEKAVSLLDLTSVNLLKKEDVIESTGFINKLLTKFQDPKTTTAYTLLNKFLQEQEPAIKGTKINPLAAGSATASERFLNFSLELTNSFEQGLNQTPPLTPNQMLNSASPYYIWKNSNLTVSEGGYLTDRTAILNKSLEVGGARKKLTVPQEIEQLEKEVKELGKTMPFVDLEKTDKYKKLDALLEKQKSFR